MVKCGFRDSPGGPVRQPVHPCMAGRFCARIWFGPTFAVRGPIAECSRDCPTQVAVVPSGGAPDGCGADHPPCPTFVGGGTMWACSSGRTIVGRTASPIAISASLKTAASPVAGETWRGPARRVGLGQYVGLGGGPVCGAVDTGRWAVGGETGGHRSRSKMVATGPNPNLFPVEAGENPSAEQACLRSRRSLMQTAGRPMPRLRLLWWIAPTESICALCRSAV